MGDERSQLIREVRQRLEALRRAGLDRLPRPMVATEPILRTLGQAAPRPIVSEPLPVVQPLPATQPVPRVQPPEPAPIVPSLASPATLFGESEPEGAAVPPAERPARLAALAMEVAACTRCPLLASTRTQTVFGEGHIAPRLMFIGEAPGADEDRTGRPFVGRAGALLTDMITKGMGLTREEVYIANVLKSRPPDNRNPLPDEVAHCLPFLEQQIQILRPEFLCLLGKVAASAILDTELSVGRLRKRWHRYRGIPALVTYHPSYLLRTPAAKKDAWEDLQILMNAMGITPPRRNKG
jgi:uracil-DNA glycosylase family 4